MPIHKAHEAEKKSESAQIDQEDFHVSPFAIHALKSGEGEHGPETLDLPGTDWGVWSQTVLGDHRNSCRSGTRRVAMLTTQSQANPLVGRAGRYSRDRWYLGSETLNG